MTTPTQNNTKKEEESAFKIWLAELERCHLIDFCFRGPLTPTLEIEEWKEVYDTGITPRDYIEDMLSYGD